MEEDLNEGVKMIDLVHLRRRNCDCTNHRIVRGQLPRYRLRYKKTLKETGSPIVVWDLLLNKETTTDVFYREHVDISMRFGNSIKQEIQCGATTILEVYEKGVKHIE